MSRKKKVGYAIENAYRGGRVTENVKNIKLNRKKYEEALDDPETYTRIDEVYKRYGIKYFADEDEYFEYMENIFPNMSVSDMRKLWREYEYREKLIATGQYEEYRLQLIKDNYIKAARRANLSEEVINNLEKLPVDKWRDLFYLGNDKEKVNDYKLPRIGEFVYIQMGVELGGESNTNNEIEEQIKSAFEALNYEWEESRQIKRGKAYLSRHGIDMEEYDEENYDELSYEEKLDTLGYYIAEDLKDRGIKIREGKKSQYIPGVGSSREGTKNRDLFLAVKRYM